MKSKTKKKLQKKLKQHKYAVMVAVAMVLLGIAGLIYIFLHPIEQSGPKRLVTFYDRGKQQVVLTRADTVQGALGAATLKINPQDIVEPSQSSKLTTTHVDVIIYRSRLVAVVDGKVRQSVVTVAQSPNAILKDAKLNPLGSKDKATFSSGDLVTNGSSVVLTIERVKLKPHRVVFKPRPDALTASKGAHVFVDSAGVAHRETYYDLPMNVVIGACGPGGTYKIRSDGAKVDQNGYVLVAANLNSYPRCTVVETSLGPGKVYDTGGFAVRHPYGFDLATDWTNYNGQ
ncbi:MAG TPA: ubiquitin-like domain-containing protein [Candidatus Saccharibacteria bacterium]|nr:ubiquitin-like domain-containing protein [Candidatus Saccharibacteria bacterium]HRK94457.1 ubiquitin-like domain-containing protein [Candidatus Saccharibacteria bacterium]